MKHALVILSVILSVFTFSSTVNAQTNYEDVLYLKNGSIIHGVIIEQVPNESIKIKTKDNNVFVYKMDEVLKIAKEELPAVHQGREPLSKDNVKKSGYINILEFTFARDVLNNSSNAALTGNSSSGAQPSIGVQDINGYLINPHVSIGFGMGLHVYTDIILAPFFADVRYNLFNNLATPFASMGIGYSFSAKEIYGINQGSKDYFGGVLANPAIGIKFFTRRSKGLTFSLGYRYQQARIYTHNYIFSNSTHYYTDGYQNQVLGYLNLKFGFSF